MTKRIQKPTYRGKERSLEALQPHIDALLRGIILQPDEETDRQALARVADFIRSLAFVPVETIRLVDPRGNSCVAYRMTEGEIHAYHNNREAQKARQQAAIKRAKHQRDARRAAALFKEYGLALPPVIEELTRYDGPEPGIPVVHVDLGFIKRPT